MTTVGEAPTLLSEFLAGCGYGRSSQLASLGGGGRHRVLAVGEGEDKGVLKVYEQTSEKGRDAFRREMAVHDVLSAHLPGRIPPVVARSEEARCALFRWVEGRKPRAGDVGAEALRRMARFVAEINSSAVRGAALAADLPHASDAAFTLAGHQRIARDRLAVLLAGEGILAEEVSALVRGELLPALDAAAEERDCSADKSAAPAFLSPSDFGFHNVIIRPCGDFCFIDFEHAGWDDPAKMAADFILQPECPLGPESAGDFLAGLEASAELPSCFRARVAAMLPVQAVKWTSIILNVFNRPSVSPDVLSGRLRKARSYWRETSRRLAPPAARQS